MSRRADGERDHDLNKLEDYLAQPRTLDDLTNRFDCSRRTIYRYITDLQDSGVNVVRIGVSRPTQYKLA